MVRYTDLVTRRPDGQPVIDLEAVCNINEILSVKFENERRAHKAAEREARKK